MRVILDGPRFGPLRTILWSWSPRRRARPARLPRPAAPRRARRRWWPQALAVLLLIGGIGKAYEAHVWLGILITVLLAGIAALVVHGLIVAAGPRHQGRTS